MLRKSLLYRSEVEYGGWCINHVLGCKHGCTYPCCAAYQDRASFYAGIASDVTEWCLAHAKEVRVKRGTATMSALP